MGGPGGEALWPALEPGLLPLAPGEGSHPKELLGPISPLLQGSRLPCSAVGPRQNCGRAKGSKHGSYLITSARCGEKYTVENTTLTTYKNSHPYCHSALSISSKNLFRWRDSSCSQSTLWLDDGNPLPIRYRGGGPAVAPGRAPLPARQPCGVGWLPEGWPRGPGRLHQQTQTRTHTFSDAAGSGPACGRGVRQTLWCSKQHW